MKRIMTWLTISVIVLVMFTAVGVHLAEAGAEGTYTGLYFPDSTAASCGNGGWYVTADPYNNSVWVRYWRPGNVEYTLTDGNQRVVMQGTVNIFDSFPNAQGLRLPTFGVPNGNWTGAVNPIHAVVRVDGDLVADLTADNPCLSAANGQSAPPASNPSGACMASAVRNGIRLRGGPGTTYAVLGNLQAQQSYAVQGQGRDDAGVIWWQITVPSIGAAWVISTFSTTSGNCSTVPTVGAAPAAQSTANPAANAVCALGTQTSGLRMRGGPGVDYAMVGRMQSGTAYAVVGQNTDSQGVVWWQIDAGSIGRAWVISTYVSTRGDCSGVPLVTVTP